MKHESSDSTTVSIQSNQSFTGTLSDYHVYNLMEAGGAQAQWTSGDVAVADGGIIIGGESNYYQVCTYTTTGYLLSVQTRLGYYNFVDNEYSEFGEIEWAYYVEVKAAGLHYDWGPSYTLSSGIVVSGTIVIGFSTAFTTTGAIIIGFNAVLEINWATAWYATGGTIAGFGAVS